MTIVWGSFVFVCFCFSVTFKVNFWNLESLQRKQDRYIYIYEKDLKGQRQ